jgi:hypothetical protein
MPSPARNLSLKARLFSSIVSGMCPIAEDSPWE